jgi:hypothetical protein
MTLAEKLHAIQTRATKLPKRGESSEKGREYNYLMIEDAVRTAKRLMRKYKLILTPFVSQHTRTENNVDVFINWTLEDIKSKESRSFCIPGSGWDLYDKATAKAMTNSRKYAIVLIFNLETGNDESLPKPTETQKEIAKQKIEVATGQEFSTLEHAEAEMLNRQEVDPKKAMKISWPEEHNGHRFFLTGRRNAPADLHVVIEECSGKWNDRQMGWFILSDHADLIRSTIKRLGVPLIEQGQR